MIYVEHFDILAISLICISGKITMGNALDICRGAYNIQENFDCALMDVFYNNDRAVNESKDMIRTIANTLTYSDQQDIKNDLYKS